MPRAVKPRPALNFTGIHSEYSPTFSVKLSEPTVIRARSLVPLGRTATHTLDRGLAERDRILAHLYTPFRAANFCRREEWEVVVQVPCKKIVNVVFAGIDSCHERRPSHWRDWRKRRAQFAKCSLVAQLSQIGQFPFGDESAG